MKNLKENLKRAGYILAEGEEEKILKLFYMAGLREKKSIPTEHDWVDENYCKYPREDRVFDVSWEGNPKESVLF